MKKNFLPILILFAGLVPSLANAQATSQLQVSANVMEGCIISAQDISFGDISFTRTQTEKIDTNFKIRCSKGTEVTLGAKSKNNPNGYSGAWMTKNDEQVVQNYSMKSPDTGIQYAIRTNNIESNSEYTLTQRPTYNWLNSYKNKNNHYMKFKILTNNEVSLPMYAKILEAGEEFSNNDFKKLTAGNYYDFLTYELTY